MTGKTNQIETPFGAGVPAALGVNIGGAGGLALIPNNPGVSYTGTPHGWLFNIWQSGSTAGGSYTEPLIVATYNRFLFLTLSTLDFGSIQILDGILSITSTITTSIVGANLIQVSSDIALIMSSLTTFTLNALQYVGGNFTFTASSLASVSFPALIAVNGIFGPTVAAATSMSVPSLVYIGSNFTGTNAAITSIDLSSLQYVGGTFSPTLAGLATLNLPAIVRILGAVTISAVSLVTFSFGSTLKQVGGNVTMTGMALNQSSVDNILVRLAALDGTGGTTAYSSLTVNLSGGTSATPSATGLAAKTTLQGRGCTVTTN